MTPEISYHLSECPSKFAIKLTMVVKRFKRKSKKTNKSTGKASKRQLGQTVNQSCFSRKSLLFLPSLSRVKHTQHGLRISKSPGSHSSFPEPQREDPLTRPNAYSILIQTKSFFWIHQQKEKKKPKPGKLDLSEENTHNPCTSLKLLMSKEMRNSLVCWVIPAKTHRFQYT